jgi:hypothetical protein
LAGAGNGQAEKSWVARWDRSALVFELLIGTSNSAQSQPRTHNNIRLAFASSTAHHKDASEPKSSSKPLRSHPFGARTFALATVYFQLATDSRQLLEQQETPCIPARDTTRQ